MSYREYFTVALSAFGMVIAGIHSSHSAEISTATDTIHRRIAFMCEWVDGRYESSWRLRPCDAQEVAGTPDADLISAMEGFIRDYTGPADIHLTQAEFELAYLQKYPNASRKPLEGEMAALPVDRLCGSVRYKNEIADNAVSELARRKVLTNNDLRFVRKHSIGIGMSEAALACLMGKPEKRNRTVTAKGEDIQWVYGKTLVYTVNGVVTAFQD